jgi:flagellar M-ring protein FliF
VAAQPGKAWAMEFLKSQLGRIQEQLGGLTASQRMLAGSLVVIMVMTLFWWSTYAGRAEMEAVVDQATSRDDLAMMIASLDAQGIPNKVVGDRLHVPADRKIQAWGVLSLGQLLPRDTQNALDAMLQRSGPFDSPAKSDRLWNDLKQNTLASMIRTYPDVAHAMVLIDAKSTRGPGKVDPTATVNITMRRGIDPSEKMIHAAADLVSGSVAGLQRANVKVIVNGASYPMKNRETAGGLAGANEWLAHVQRAERYYADKVKALLPHIEGAMVSVTVRPNTKQSKSVEHKVDPKNVVSKAVTESTTTEESKSGADSGEPGVKANSPLSAGPANEAPRESTSSTTEQTQTANMVDHGRIDEETTNHGGDVPVTAATLLVPRSYFVGQWKGKMGQPTKEPEPAELDPFIANELVALKATVQTAVGLDTTDSIHVNSYVDTMPVAGVAPQAASSTMTIVLTSHAKEIALGVLAVVSLLMVSNIVRKSTPTPVLAIPDAPAAAMAGPLGGREEPVGEAREGAPALDGMELDEDSARAQQILAQVSDLVGENPDAAANLVKRWLNRA